MRRLWCFLFGHSYHVHQHFGPHSRRVICLDCDGDWGMNDQVKGFIPWTQELEEVYRLMGFRIRIHPRYPV